MVDGKFEYAWELEGGDFVRQDKEIAGPTTNKVSIHTVTREELSQYHAGVDTIDAICFSWFKQLTEGELDKICEEYLKKEKVRSEEAANFVRGGIEEFEYNGDE